MGARGPKPKPTELKELEGTARKDRAAPNQPRPKVKIPSAPAWLGPDAKAEWRRVTKQLAALKMIAELDRTTLGLYCQALQEYLDAVRALEAERAHQDLLRARRADEMVLRKAAAGATDVDDEPLSPNHGLTAWTAQGSRTVHPLVSIRNEAWKRVLKAAAEFGMSPSSRTRISIPIAGPEQQPANPFMQLVK